MNNSLSSKRGLRFWDSGSGQIKVQPQKAQPGPAWAGGHWAALIDLGRPGRLEFFSQVSWLSQASLRVHLSLLSSVQQSSRGPLLYSLGFTSPVWDPGPWESQRSCNSTVLCLKCVTPRYLFGSLLLLFYLIQHSALKGNVSDKWDPGWDRTAVISKTWQDE